MTNQQQAGSAAIIGGGTMGTDIAAIFCAGGWSVQIVEPQRSRWPAVLERVSSSSAQLGGTQPRATLCASASELDWARTGIVIECAPEDLALKRTVFAELERLAPAHVPLASNSSSLPITAIGEHLATRSRMLGLHFFMPAHLVPAVEVIRGEATDPEVCERCAHLMRSLGKVPVNVRKDVPGFLANRLQHALTREAFALIDEGFASAEDVDAAVRYGFGFRFVAAGPVLQKDIAGLDIHCAAATTMYPHLANDDKPAAVLRERVAAGKLGMKTGEGFYRWTPESARREKERYERALLDALAILKRDMGNP